MATDPIISGATEHEPPREDQACGYNLLAHASTTMTPGPVRASSFLPKDCTPAVGWPNCDVRPADCVEKAGPRDVEPVTFQPFMVYSADGCANFPHGAEWRQRASEQLAMYLSCPLERELATGEMTGNPSLASEATIVGTGGPYPLETAIIALAKERRRAGFTGCTNLVVPEEFLLALGTAGLLQDCCGGRPRLWNGWGVIAGCFGDGPEDGTFLYTVGDVFVTIGPEIVSPEAPEQEYRTNRVDVVAERPVLVEFSPCTVYGIQVEDC